MAFPKLLQRLFQNEGAGSLLNKSIIPAIQKSDLPSIDVSDLTDNTFELMPAGVMMPFAGKSIPSGWLLCNGANVSRTTYAKLFAAIGTTWGAGDGSTTFTLPNCEGRFLEGTTSTSNVGTYLEAGLPNISGRTLATAGSLHESQAGPNGAFYMGSDANTTYCINYVAASNRKFLKIMASNSSSLYGASTTVQVPSAYALIIIKA